jgi:hypothetical protein
MASGIMIRAVRSVYWTKGLEEFQIEYCLNLVVSIESLNYSSVKCELAIRFGTVAFLRWR